jgi:hypothetical protein
MGQNHYACAAGGSSVAGWRQSLIELDERRLYVREGYSASGAITLTGVKLLAPHLTEDNHKVLFDSARGKSKRETEHLVAQLQPHPRSSARHIPLPPRGSGPRSSDGRSQPASNAAAS